MGRGLEHLHPAARAKAGQLQTLCREQGLLLLITETMRTVAEQDRLYAQGRTAPGSVVTNAKGSAYQSPHQWGVAFDFCKNVRGQEYSDIPFFNGVGFLGKTIGLFWGGDFRGFVDRPHFELPEFVVHNSTAALRRQYGSPESFIKTWRDYDLVETIAVRVIRDGKAETVDMMRIFKDGRSYFDVHRMAQALGAKVYMDGKMPVLESMTKKKTT